MTVAITLTAALSPLRPSADAVIVADPKSMPFTIGSELGVVAPGAKMTLGVLTVTFVMSLLDKETTRPPCGAGFARVTCIGVAWPG